MNYIPIKVNLSGVIPPIFASAVLMFPVTILQSSTNEYLVTIADALPSGRILFNFFNVFIIIVLLPILFFQLYFMAENICDT